MLSVINIVRDSLSKAELLIGDYFIENSSTLYTQDIKTIAEEVGVSTASVSRFVTKVFNMSFQEFKIKLASESDVLEEPSPSEIFNWANDWDSMKLNMIETIKRTCENVLKVNTDETFKKVVYKLSVAEHIYIYGVGNSGIVAQDIQEKLIKLGVKAQFLQDSHLAVMSSAFTTEKDVVIAISASGESKEVNIAAESAKENNSTIISITSTFKNELIKKSDISIIAPSKEDKDSRLAAIFSRYAQLYVSDIIFVGLAKELADSPEEIIGKYKEQMKGMRG